MIARRSERNASGFVEAFPSETKQTRAPSPLILTVHVKPSARRASLEWLDEDTLKVGVTAPPEKGKANQAVIEALAEELGVAKSTIVLHRGATARIKQFKISNFQKGL